MNNDRHINFKLLRDRILNAGSADVPSASSSKQYWRSLEELADSPIFEEFVRREFPEQAEEWNDPVERRTFLKLMGASLALAGLSGCVIQPPEKIVPYVKQPEEEVPGRGLYFATVFSLGGIATPVLVRSNEGRPTKIEGNPDHPNNRNADPNDKGSSATDIFSQASILTLYDPDRSQTPVYRGETRPWTQFVAEIRGLVDKENDGLKAKKGGGLRFLTETITSPTLAAQMKQILTDFPEAKWHQYEPVNRDNARAGAIMAFSQDVNTIYDFSKADRVLSLGSDFLAAMPGSLRYARDFAAKRRSVAQADSLGADAADQMNRLYVTESTPTITGANADHKFSMKPADAASWADMLRTMIGAGSSTLDAAYITGNGAETFKSIAKDLLEHKGASVVIPGRSTSRKIHAIAHAMNEGLGN